MVFGREKKVGEEEWWFLSDVEMERGKEEDYI